MATHAADGIEWLLELPAADRELLAPIRHWPGLRIASLEGSLWIAGLSEAQIKTAELRSLPAKNVWRKESGELFRNRNLVPSRKAPALLWSPVSRGLPLELPAWNHALAACDDRLRPELIRDAIERPAIAMIAGLGEMASYIEDAPAVRLRKLHWCIIAPDEALIYGVPALPVPARTLWLDGDFLVPSGFAFAYPELVPLIAKKTGSATGDTFILWAPDGSWTAIPKSALAPLSIGSFRQSRILNSQHESHG